MSTAALASRPKVFTSVIELAQVPIVLEVLIELVQSKRELVSLTLAGDEVLEEFERVMRDKAQSLVDAHTLISPRFSFFWWIEAAIWPSASGGWTVLLRRATMTAQPAQRPMLHKAG
jgi:hypothetical protein